MSKPIYDESTIKSLDWKEHIRTRPGMYIGKLGDGTSHDDGIYILLKEVLVIYLIFLIIKKIRKIYLNLIQISVLLQYQI